MAQTRILETAPMAKTRVAIACIEMANDLHEMLDYESKIDRSARNIDRPIAEGERSARRFLAERAERYIE